MEDSSLSEQLLKLFEQVKTYFGLRLEYFKLHVAEYLIRFFSSLALWFVIFLFLFFVVVFGSFAFAFWFGKITGNWSLGFLIVAGFYVLLAIFFYVFRKAIIVKPFTSLILSQMDLDKFNDKENEKEQ
jgi:hypothetical protein